MQHCLIPLEQWPVPCGELRSSSYSVAFTEYDIIRWWVLLPIAIRSSGPFPGTFLGLRALAVLAAWLACCSFLLLNVLQELDTKTGAASISWRQSSYETPSVFSCQSDEKASRQTLTQASLCGCRKLYRNGDMSRWLSWGSSQWVFQHSASCLRSKRSPLCDFTMISSVISDTVCAKHTSIIQIKMGAHT